MQGYKKCNNGHFYKEALENCPYCPDLRSGSAGSNDNTSIVGNAVPTTVMDALKTEVYSNSTSTQNEEFLGDKTLIFTQGGNQASPGKQSGEGNSNNQFDRTFIGTMPTDGSAEDGTGSSPVKPRSARRIVGWIISYTIDPMGVDYRIFEGNNTIGRDVSNSIILSKDVTISARHITLLYKAGKFWVKDEMSANGSFLNKEEMEIQKAYQLNDNDELRLGNTVFRFKSAE